MRRYRACLPAFDRTGEAIAWPVGGGLDAHQARPTEEGEAPAVHLLPQPEVGERLDVPGQADAATRERVAYGGR